MLKMAIMILMTWALATPGLADDIQTDWSGGDVQPGPVPIWNNAFATANDISWGAVPGQIALSSSGQTPGVKYLLADGQEGAFGVEAADLDGDGDVDLVGAAELGGVLTVWYNNGDRPVTFTESVVDAGFSGVSAVYASDLDGDQDLDLVACSGTQYGGIFCYLNNGGEPGSWTAVEVVGNWGHAWEIATGDIDGDGNMDIVGTFISNSEVAWFRNDGADPIGWSRHTVDGAFNGAHSVRAGDIDGDGNTDLVGCGSTSNQVAWWKNSGTSPVTWSKQVISGTFNGARSVRIGDLDRDGDLDVAACGFNSQVAWWSNGGGEPAVWTKQTVDSSLTQTHQMQLADLNGDGWLDMAAVAYGSNAVAWWENSGGDGPLAWTRHFADYSLADPLALDVGDVDGDGALEIIASSNTADQFNWYDSSEFVASGVLTSSIHDTGGQVPGELDWTAETPPGTALHFQVRSGEDPGALGPWSTDIAAPGPLDGDIGRYFQYRVFLSSSDAEVSPILEEVNFPPSVAAVPSAGSGPRLRTFPNPANPRVVVAFDMPRNDWARLDVFDVRGRRVKQLGNGSFTAGRNEITWNGTDASGQAVASGTYHVLMRTASGEQRARVTLLR